jgi:hypothetical protein
VRFEEHHQRKSTFALFAELSEMLSAVLVALIVPFALMEHFSVSLSMQLEIFLCAFAGIRTALRYKCDIWQANRKLKLSDIHSSTEASKKSKYGLSFWCNVIAAIPFYSSLAWLTDYDLQFLLLVRFVELRGIKSLWTLVSGSDYLHPIVAKLVPMGVLVPLIIHAVGIGWLALGASSSNDRVLEYVRSVYWAVTTLTTVGYGDIVAKNIPQMLYSMVIEMVGVGFFGFVLGNIASVIARMDSAKVRHMEAVDRLETFLRYHEVPTEIRAKARAYQRYVWESKHGYDDQAVLQTLPQNIKSDVAFFIHGEIATKVPLLKGASEVMLRELVLELKPIISAPGQEIFRVGDSGTGMYFIEKGQVAIQTATGENIVTLVDGQFFGELALLTRGTRGASAVSMSYSDLYFLERTAFEHVLKRYPDFATGLRTEAERRETKNATTARAS